MLTLPRPHKGVIVRPFWVFLIWVNIALLWLNIFDIDMNMNEIEREVFKHRVVEEE